MGLDWTEVREEVNEREKETKEREREISTPPPKVPAKVNIFAGS